MLNVPSQSPSSAMLHRTATHRISRTIAFAAAIGVVFASAASWASAGLPPEFAGVDVQNKLGAKIDLDVTLLDHEGHETKLSRYFDGKRPVILTLNYYMCESLCSTQLNELLKAVRKLEWIPGGDEFQMVTISFDPRDSSETAAGKRLSYAREYVRGKAKDAGEELAADADAVDAKASTLGWEFMTGSPESIRTITERLGYTYKFDEKSGQYAHSPVVYVMSPDGVVSRYLFGITYNQRDLKFALIDASDGKIGDFGEKILLSCFAFDPDGSGYGASAFGIMRLGGLLMVLLLGTYLIVHFRRERRAKRARAASNTPSAA